MRRASPCVAAACRDSGVVAYLVDAPSLYRRGGGPYQDDEGVEWVDNLQRFALLGWVGAHLAIGELDPQWRPSVVHAHDWHAALACAYLAAHPPAQARCVFTVHNLAYQGRFPGADFGLLGLPARFMGVDGLEFYGEVSFMKAGLQFADRITTVSPSYAAEIATPAFGEGLDGVIRARGGRRARDPQRRRRRHLGPGDRRQLAGALFGGDAGGKAACKAALQEEFGLDAQRRGAALRHRQPVDVAKGAGPDARGAADAARSAAVSSRCWDRGSRRWRPRSCATAAAQPRQVAVRIGYDEALAHRIVAGVDALIVPSRFEPCGLVQLYGLRYGSVPVVQRVGGLADTVVDATAEALAADRATGFAFEGARVDELEGRWRARSSPCPTRRLAADRAARHGAGFLLV